jgi:hypothetical protein
MGGGGKTSSTPTKLDSEIVASRNIQANNR